MPNLPEDIQSSINELKDMLCRDRELAKEAMMSATSLTVSNPLGAQMRVMAAAGMQHEEILGCISEGLCRAVGIFWSYHMHDEHAHREVLKQRMQDAVAEAIQETLLAIAYERQATENN